MTGGREPELFKRNRRQQKRELFRPWGQGKALSYGQEHDIGRKDRGTGRQTSPRGGGGCPHTVLYGESGGEKKADQGKGGVPRARLNQWILRREGGRDLWTSTG